MRSIILGKSLLSDEEILAFAMSEENRRLLTMERLHQHAVYAALSTASLLLRLQASTATPMGSAPQRPDSTDPDSPGSLGRL